MLSWLALTGCVLPVSVCGSDVDCASAFGVGWTCGVQGLCVPPNGLPETDELPTFGTNDTDSSTTSPTLAPVLIINEVLYDPSNDPPGIDGVYPGDANGDGVYVHDEDEFVEFVNISGGTADVSGFSLWDTEAWELNEPRHVVPTNTSLAPGQALVIFGGGTPYGSFGGAVVQVATGGALNLNNSNDLLRVADADGNVVATFELEPRSDDPDESYSRNPDITGLFEQHGDNTPYRFSPGVRVDLTPFP